MHATSTKHIFLATFLLSLFALLSLNTFALDPLPVDNAFPHTVEIQGKEISLQFSMRDDYYMHQHAFKFVGDDNFTLGEFEFPEAKSKYDEFVGDTLVYDQDIELRIPFSIKNRSAKNIVFTYTFQGCLTDGICYPPTTRNAVLSPKGGINFVGTPIPKEERNTASLIDEAFTDAPQNYKDKSAAVQYLEIEDLNVEPLNTETKASSVTGSFIDIFGGDSIDVTEDDILPVEKAFQLSMDVQDNGYLQANWYAESTYYLYQDKLTFKSDNPDIKLGTPVAVVLSIQDYESLEALKLESLKHRAAKADEQILAGQLVDGEAAINELLSR